MNTKLLIGLWVIQSLNSASAQTGGMESAKNLALNYVTSHHLKEVNNAFVDEHNVMHIFVYQDFSSLLKAFPTTATEKHRFQVHLFVNKEDKEKYTLVYTGNYNPVFTFEESGQDVGARGLEEIDRVDFPVAGPYTGTLQMELKQRIGQDNVVRPVGAVTVHIAKTVYASLGYGLLYSSLKNPGNVHAAPRPAGDSTLIADDANGRGITTILATFYPWGRNSLLLPSWSLRDRLGILVGTSIGSKAPTLENFFLGGQYDFAIGGSVITGVHYGKRLKIVGVDYKNFTFGESKFSGDVETRKYSSWDVGFFLGVQVDSRILSKVFK